MAHQRDERRALVTGAASGLAAGIAAALPADGFSHVAITYRTTPPDATLAAISDAGAIATAAPLDFLDPAPVVAERLGALVASDGPFDTLVHAVGPLVVRRFARTGIEQYAEMFDGNVRSAVQAAAAVLPAMRDAGFGRIVFFGCIGARDTQPFRGFSLYQAAKSALTAFARTLALEEARNGVTVNVVVPGDVRDKTRTRAEALALSAPNPRGRPGTFEDIADAVRFLLARRCDFVTGAVLEVTGGSSVPDERNEPPS